MKKLTAEQAVDSLASLAQESRLAIFRLLVRKGPDGLPAGAIAEKLGVPAATLSFHLNHLSNANLVSSKREGRSIIYSANFKRMDALIAYLGEHCCKGV